MKYKVTCRIHPTTRSDSAHRKVKLLRKAMTRARCVQLTRAIERCKPLRSFDNLLVRALKLDAQLHARYSRAVRYATNRAAIKLREAVNREKRNEERRANQKREAAERKTLSAAEIASGKRQCFGETKNGARCKSMVPYQNQRVYCSKHRR